MTYRPTPRSLLLAAFILSFGFAAGFRVQGQVLNQDQEIHVHNLPTLKAHSQEPLDVLLASLETVFHDPEICCGKNSALGDSAQAADPKSLKDVAEKLQGRHLLSDGRPIKVTAEFATLEVINGGALINNVMNQQAALLMWNSHVYVVHGVVYQLIASGSSEGGWSQTTVLHKFLLWDTRFTDSRREVVLDRTTEDLTKVQGMLFVQVAQ